MKKILLAEDNKPMSRTMRIKLEKSGFEVVVAMDGKEAMDALMSEKFDLVLLDIMMPRMSGFEVLREMRNRGIAAPVIMTSNLSQESDIKKAKDLGAREYFVKSNASISEIVEYVKNSLPS
ncbi:MAG: response regulator [Candidatus Moranbacteria bacterium]|nr:response regulator [Candidatus Moranbacteria bacterium]